ncbi:unnamed protein product [Clonostachys byssicola]|uniref:Amino acid permease/ SLC12A domain-containing protein n=1 Tax=Clonostachys byssicola TaxID=160290 RepID=A0A9N9Y1N5_9HYPO|nr:unnamed protein product [Clonostachys byssicola]
MKSDIESAAHHGIAALGPEKFDDPEKPRNDSIRGLETSVETSLHKELKARHISMIAIGGALGTGLLIGTGQALAESGPGSLLIAFLFMGVIIFMIMAAIGEIAAWLPLSAGFAGYATRYCHPALGFALGWTYWFNYALAAPNQLTAVALVIQFWVPRETVNPGVFIAIFIVLIFSINYFGGIKFFGEFEFWLSSFKVIVIVGIILLSLVITCGGGPSGEATGFRYWKDPGAFAEIYTTGPLGKFLGFWSVMVNATFAYLGTELVGTTAAEAKNPRRSIPKAIRLTFYRILFFYCLSIFLAGLIVPYNSEALLFAANQPTPGANASPFVVAAKVAGIKVLPHVINACICMFVFSASNSDLYIGSRTLYGLASDRAAPAIFKRTDRRGVPWVALLACTSFALLAFMNASDDSRSVFKHLINVCTVLGLLTWISILITHIRFVRGRRAKGIPDSAMPYTAPQGIWGSYAALVICIIVALTKSYGVFILQGKPFDYASFITGYIGIPVYLVLLFGHMLTQKSKLVKIEDMDFFTGKDIVDRYEAEFLEAEAAREGRNSKWVKVYDRTLPWLF